jgi:hypothetical protein
MGERLGPSLQYNKDASKRKAGLARSTKGRGLYHVRVCGVESTGANRGCRMPLAGPPITHTAQFCGPDTYRCGPEAG